MGLLRAALVAVLTGALLVQAVQRPQAVNQRKELVISTGFIVEADGDSEREREWHLALQAGVAAAAQELLQLPAEDVEASSPVTISSLTFRLRVTGRSVSELNAEVVATELGAVLGPRIGAEDDQLRLLGTVSEGGTLTLLGRASISSGENFGIKMRAIEMLALATSGCVRAGL